MPIYLAHGFRWPRDGFTGIRVHAIIYEVDEMSVEYIQNEHSRRALLDSFRENYPETMEELEKPGRAIDFLEQYDPEDESPTATTQPWAFVCDRVVMIAGGENAEYYASSLLHQGGMKKGGGGEEEKKKKERKKTLPMTIAAPFTAPASVSALSINFDEVRAEGTGASPEAWHAFQDLRDEIAEGETIGWWVVYNGDPDRAFDAEDEDEDEDGETATPAAAASPPPSEETPKSPRAGGRMPPPVGPTPTGNRSQTQRSSTHSTLTEATTRTTTSSTGRRVSEPAGTTPDSPKAKATARGQGLKKFFRKKS